MADVAFQTSALLEHGVKAVRAECTEEQIPEVDILASSRDSSGVAAVTVLGNANPRHRLDRMEGERVLVPNRVAWALRVTQPIKPFLASGTIVNALTKVGRGIRQRLDVRHGALRPGRGQPARLGGRGRARLRRRRGALRRLPAREPVRGPGGPVRPAPLQPPTRRHE